MSSLLLSRTFTDVPIVSYRSVKFSSKIAFSPAVGPLKTEKRKCFPAHPKLEESCGTYRDRSVLAD